ncbi:MAG: hypothetical protein HQK53_02930 [Oligoflexia bacterium]|nr:hypothetical protein [Oligoflexia bacterium]
MSEKTSNKEYGGLKIVREFLSSLPSIPCISLITFICLLILVTIFMLLMINSPSFFDARADETDVVTREVIKEVAVTERVNATPQIILEQVDDLFNRGEITPAAKLSEENFNKMLDNNSGSGEWCEVFLKNAIIMYLANNQIDKSVALFLQGKQFLQHAIESKKSQCNINSKVVQEIAEIISKKIIEDQGRGCPFNMSKSPIKSLSSMKSVLKAIDIGKYFQSLLQTYNKLRCLYLNNNLVADANEIADNKIKKYYLEARKKNEKIDIDDLEIIALLENERLSILINEMENISLDFSVGNLENKLFVTRLQMKLDKLNVITEKATSILSIGAGEGSVNAYFLLSTTYKNFVSELSKAKNTIEISNSSNDTATDSENNGRNHERRNALLVKLIDTIEKKGVQFKQEAKKIITKYTILAHNNDYFLLDRGGINVDGKYIGSGLFNYIVE